MVKKRGVLKMIKQEVIFNVKNLMISKTKNIFATEGIRNVFEAVFQFHSSDWDNLTKTAVFENVEGTKELRLLVDDKCDIPDSFFKTSGVCYVSVMAGDFMVTNKAAIIVVNAGYTSGDTVPDAKNYFEQLLRYFDATNTNVQEYGKLAERFAVGLPFSNTAAIPIPIHSGSFTVKWHFKYCFEPLIIPEKLSIFRRVCPLISKYNVRIR